MPDCLKKCTPLKKTPDIRLLKKKVVFCLEGQASDCPKKYIFFSSLFIFHKFMIRRIREFIITTYVHDQKDNNLYSCSEGNEDLL